MGREAFEMEGLPPLSEWVQDKKVMGKQVSPD